MPPDKSCHSLHTDPLRMTHGDDGRNPRHESRTPPVFAQEVEVRISADLWVVGIVICALELFRHAGHTYRIAFAEPDGSRRQRDFSAEAIRPRQSPPSGSRTRR